MIYFAELGKKLTEEGEYDTKRSANGIITLWEMLDKNTSLTVLAKSAPIPNGDYGYPLGTEIYKAGSNGKWGWKLFEGGLTMGEFVSFTFLFLKKGASIIEVGYFLDYFDNSGWCGEGDGEDVAEDERQICNYLESINGEMQALIHPSKPYYDLELKMFQTSTPLHQPPKQINRDFIIHFDETKHQYELRECQ
jgi:hypothetical protein